jgi:two-component system sensor histidine kinase AlgZ
MKLMFSLPAWCCALLINFGLWTLLCIVAGVSTYVDATHHHDTRSLTLMTLGWWCGYAVMMVQSYLLYLVYQRHPRWLATPRRILGGYLLYLVLCWPVAMMGLAYRRCFKLDLAPTLANAWRYWLSMDKFEWFVEFALLTLAFGVVAAVLLWRHRQQHAAELADVRLSLERQRLAALRGQLEPHFLFNTLSAIGAVVRTGDQPAALDGLARLGDLLHYALSTSECDWVDLQQEWQFVNDYLDLQRLRFGDRLQVRVHGVQLLDADFACPPMLLQPLVENALRHDLECHPGTSDIRIAFARDGACLAIEVSNPVFPHAATRPPGLGIGLRGIGARLQLAYGALATLDSVRADGRFVARVRLPWQAVE